VDTAYAYGDSERITGMALQDGYREKVTLASKIPLDMLKEESDFERILDEELARLQTDHIDVYLLHAMSRKRWDTYMEKFHVIEHLEKAKRDGKIRHIGFSFHDSYDAFLEILNGYDGWDFCQIQLNYQDVNYQAGIAGLEEANRRGLAVVIMEPLRGGALVNVPEDVAALLPKSPVESALDFLWNLPQVSVVLSGMSTTEQVEQNMAYAHRAHAGMLTDREVTDMVMAGNKMRQKISIPCTGCNYCNICPNGIAIPDIFAMYNRSQMDGDSVRAKKEYLALEERNQSGCIECGACVAACPQHIEIPEELKKVHKRWGQS
jgi:predicted aldo/keto reductase-like oxidoreductase